MPVEWGPTGFMFTSMCLVALMTPGLALFYGGLVGEGSVLTIMMQNFVSMGVVSILWYSFLFSLCFGDSWGFFGSPGTYFFMQNVVNKLPLSRANVTNSAVSGTLFVMYQGMFAIITPALMTGTFADRFRFKPYVIFISVWLIVVYAPWCHWIWGGGFLALWGVRDYAGGLVVHTTAGFSALATLLVVGHRPQDDVHRDVPHNIPQVALGTALLWFGWFGFNGGAAMASDIGTSITACMNSQISAGVSMCVWLFLDTWRFGRPGLIGLCVGAVAGFATVTPCAGYIQPWGAYVIGLIAALVCYPCCVLVKKYGWDDALDVWGCHGMGGFVGAILIGVLSDPAECLDAATAPTWCAGVGSVARSWEQLGKQIAATLGCAIYSFTVTYVILKIIDKVVPIRPPLEIVEEHGGLDKFEHGESAYHTPNKIGATVTMAV